MIRRHRYYDSGKARSYRRARNFFSVVEELDSKIAVLLEEELEKQAEEVAERLDSPELEDLLEKAEELIEKEEARYSRYSRLRRMKYYADNGSSDQDDLAQALEKAKRRGGRLPEWFRKLLEKPMQLARTIVVALRVALFKPSWALRILVLAGFDVIGLIAGKLAHLGDVHARSVNSLLNPPPAPEAVAVGVTVLIFSIIGLIVAQNVGKDLDVKKAEEIGWKLVRGEELTDVEMAFLRKYIDEVSPKLQRLLEEKKISL